MRDPAKVYRKQAQKACMDVAREIVAEIQRQPQTPERTGNLEHSYRAVEAGDGAEVVTDADYWRWVEFGTEDTPRRPHVRPAIERVRARRLIR